MKTILGINPGTRYLGFAIFHGPELRDWGVKVAKGPCTKDKMEKLKKIVLGLIEQYEPEVLAIKQLHPSRSSPNLLKLVGELKKLSLIRKIPVHEYSIEYLEKMILSERLNKKNLVEIIFEQYPVLFSEVEKERVIFSEIEKKRSRKKIYHTRMFEAVALAHVCFNQLDNH